MPFANNTIPAASFIKPSDRLQSSHNLHLNAEDSQQSLQMNLQYAPTFSLTRVLTLRDRQPTHFFKVMQGITSTKCTLHGEKTQLACMSLGMPPPCLTEGERLIDVC